MLRNIKDLIGFRIAASDGDIGKVMDFYFDDETWTIRYLIVKTDGWLLGRRVLISPGALMEESGESGTFPVRLTKEQVCNSPDIDTDKPVSRRQEIELYGHYGWQPYWGSGFYGGGLSDTSQAPIVDERIVRESGNSDDRNENDQHLRSTIKITGYHIHATDGDIGHVNDFILDDETWQIAYLVVDTHNWIGGKKVLVAVGHVKEIQWDIAKVIIDVNVDAVKDSTADDKWKNNEPGNDQADHKTRIYKLNKELQKFH